MQIGLLVVPANVVGLAHLALAHHLEQGAGMILDIQPVAHLLAVAVHRQRLALQGVEDHQRDQFFREVIGAVVVRTIAQQYRQAIGTVPGADQMVGGRLARRVGRAGRIGRALGEQLVNAMQVAIYLVGGNMVEAKGPPVRLVQLQPIGAGGFQQGIGANDIGLDKGGRAVDGAVHVRLGRQVHDRVRLELGQGATDHRAVADIGLQELVVRVVRDAGQRFEVAGVGQLVEVEHLVLGVIEQVANQRRTNKTRAAGDQNTHEEIAL